MNTPTQTIAVVEPQSIHQSRQIERRVSGVATSDGDGVKLRRLLTHQLQRRLDPFLMLDAFGSESAEDYIGGFPDHPHRGFETVTLMLAGRMRHRDSVGNVGLLEAGSVQWMTAGRGIIHSEMPEQDEGRMAGFQLWVNLAARDKMQDPAYRDIPPEAVPVLQLPGVRARLIAGSSHGVEGAVTRPRTEPLVIDLSLAPNASFDLPIPTLHNAFLVVHEGILSVGDPAEQVTDASLVVLSNDLVSTGVRLANPGHEPARVLIVAGSPLSEPIAQHGPFVMNTLEELQQAVADFQRGVLAR